MLDLGTQQITFEIPTSLYKCITPTNIASILFEKFSSVSLPAILPGVLVMTSD